MGVSAMARERYPCATFFASCPRRSCAFFRILKNSRMRASRFCFRSLCPLRASVMRSLVLMSSILVGFTSDAMSILFFENHLAGAAAASGFLFKYFAMCSLFTLLSSSSGNIESRSHPISRVFSMSLFS